jgi:hypothetical protein
MLSRVILELPFTLHECAGSVRVELDAISDGTAAGFHVLPGLPFGPEAAIGYPAMSANVRYEGGGYRRVMAWVQVLDLQRRASDGLHQWRGVDVATPLEGAGFPFLAFGASPAIVDAPANNLAGAEALDWRADTFLVRAPLRSRDEPIVPLVGFTWGYSEYADGRPTTLRPPEPSAPGTWEWHRELLATECPGWVFGAEL